MLSSQSCDDFAVLDEDFDAGVSDVLALYGHELSTQGYIGFDPGGAVTDVERVAKHVAEAMEARKDYLLWWENQKLIRAERERQEALLAEKLRSLPPKPKFVSPFVPPHTDYWRWWIPDPGNDEERQRIVNECRNEAIGYGCKYADAWLCEGWLGVQAWK